MAILAPILNAYYQLRQIMIFKGSYKQKLQYYRFRKLAEKNGVVSLRIDRVAQEWMRDWTSITEMKDEEKLFFINHGISPYRKYLCGISQENIDNYLPETVFYNAKNYVNGLVELFDHKLHTFYLLAPFKQNLPIHHFYIRKSAGNQIAYPLEVSSSVTGTADLHDVMELIKECPIAAKRCKGGHGDGFYKFHYADGQYYINDHPVEFKDFSNCLTSLDDYILTDYVTPHKVLRKLCGEGRFSVMRVISVFDKEEGAQIVGMMIRLGCSKCGLTQAGHDYIYAGVDLNDGSLFKPRFEEDDAKLYNIERHPDTNEVITEYAIPGIQDLNNLIKSISAYLSMSPYLVFDVIPSDEGFKILEINSHGQPFIVEPYYPIRTNKYIQKVFKD